jgi:predicted DNA-binding protein
MESKGIPIGIRISEKTKERFDEYCDKYGIKKSFLLDKIIEEKLLELEEDEEDLKTALERISDETTDFESLDKYFKKRGI